LQVIYEIKQGEPKYILKSNPRIGLITLGSDFRIEKVLLL